MSLYRHVITSRRWDPQPCCCGTLVAHGEAHYCCVAFSGLVVRLVEGLPGLARPGKVRASQCGYPFWTEIFRISSPNRSPNRRARTFPGQAGPGRPLANLPGPISGSCLASIRSSASRGEPGRGGPRVRHVVSSFLGLGNVPER